MAQRVCRRCLLKEIDQEEYFKNVFEYIASLDKETRTPEDLYQKRLAVCQSCDNLINGMCRVCGCFVEVRAAKKIQSCPGIPSRW